MLNKDEEAVLAFLAREFRRQGKMKQRTVLSFSFTIHHVILGTTAVWGRGRKASSPRAMMVRYSIVLNDLVEGTLETPYAVTIEPHGRKFGYRVTRRSIDPAVSDSVLQPNGTTD